MPVYFVLKTYATLLIMVGTHFLLHRTLHNSEEDPRPNLYGKAPHDRGTFFRLRYMTVLGFH